VTLLEAAWVCLAAAAIPAVLAAVNSFFFRPPPRGFSASPVAVSVLIPARNEEASIAACVESVLASCGVELEVIVLDDHSTDRTAGVVREIAGKDGRVRLEPAPLLPEGWCGKQHACFALAQLARYPLLTFLDADVRLAPDALARLAAFQERSRAALVSGFPRQETGTLLEKLVIPLINWLLVGYLPMVGMRLSRWAAFGAGCGQWFLTTRDAYAAVGGHAAVKASLHDGLTLPRAYRRAGFQSDVCDATGLAACRMYRSAAGVWFGLAKNAREGMAAAVQLPVWTFLLVAGHVLPVFLLSAAILTADREAMIIAAAACALSLGLRLATAAWFRASLVGAVLHPVGVLILLSIQWFAAYRAAAGRPVGWKGRAHPGGTGIATGPRDR
jgi:cellulose synthase/poly-beta-1,6-N-acetylglucosamine synthase-like glycosyltransferase